MPEGKAELLQGTLDMLILKALTQGPTHGYGVARWIQSVTDDLLEIEEGSLYPALYRMNRRGWISSEWGTSEHNRRAKFYSLTAKGRGQLEEQVAGWERFVLAVQRILQVQPAY
jgi:PadR family transcriptional regulator PadR